MMTADRGANLDRESVGVRLQCGLTHHLSGNAMAAKRRPKRQTAEHKQDIKGEPSSSCRIGAINGGAKPDQYGCCIGRLGNGATWAVGRQAFLRWPLLQPS
jgi:hypothetical protein